MSDQPPPIVELPPSLPVEERPYLGHAIVGGKIRFLSVSQVVKFDARQEGGCPRAWTYEKLFGKKEIIGPDDPRNRGKRFAREAELYLKYNYDALSPVMRAGKHLLPKPGPDLEVEEDLAGSQQATIAALALRDRAIAGEAIPDDAVDKIARLTACGIPFIGAADYAHHRGVYVTLGGVVVDEPHPGVTAECGDHKTTARINEHTTRPRKKGAQPTVLPGFAKTVEQIAAHPQMLGYGIWQKNKHEYLEYVRLSHNYYQTRNGYTADKRSILLPIEEIRQRWQGTVVPVVREMIDVARVERPEDAPFNLKACRSFGRDCPHAEYCDRPARSFHEFVADAFGEGGTMSSFSFDALFPGSNVNGAPSVAPSSLPPSLPQSDEERARQITEEKAKLLATAVARHPLDNIDGYRVGQPCNGRGYYASSNNTGFVGVEPGHSCAACAKAPALPTTGSVNPADAPPIDYIASVDPLTPEAIAEITDPALRATAEAHAKAHAERAAAEKAARAADKPKTGCPGIGQTIVMTDKEKMTRKKKCPGCGKELKVRDGDFTSDFSAFVVPKHKTVESAVTTTPVLPVPVVATAAAPYVAPTAAATSPPPLPQIASSAPPLPAPPVSLGNDQKIAAQVEILTDALTSMTHVLSTMSARLAALK